MIVTRVRATMIDHRSTRSAKMKISDLPINWVFPSWFGPGCTAGLCQWWLIAWVCGVSVVVDCVGVWRVIGG